MSDTLFPGAEPVTTYLPQQWCDEIIPVTQPDPNSFLRQVNGNWFLIPEEYETGNEDGYRIAVTHGDLIAFESYRDYGQSQISVADDASYTLREPFPDDANWFVFLDGDFYNGADTIPEAIKVNREEDPDSFTPPYETEISGVFSGETTTFRVVIEEDKARLEKLPEPPLVIPYTNWRGETAIRHLRPIGVKFKSTSYHREPQWILEAFDYDRQEMRGFAMKDFGRPAPTRFKLQWECLKDDYLHVANAPLFGSIRVEHRFALGERWEVCWSVPGFQGILLRDEFPTAADAMKAVDDHVARILFPEAI